MLEEIVLLSSILLSKIGKAVIKHRILGVPINCYYESLRLSEVLSLLPFHKKDLLLHL